MAIIAFTGVPGAGKTYALVEQVILPALLAGRRVLTNIDGIDPERVHDHLAAQVIDPDSVGELVCFDGRRATEPGFFPTETISDENTIVKGGDYIVFDEWRLYWERRAKQPNPELEPFLRWHRHLSNAKGHSTDVAIGTQLATDVHQDFRGLIERSYKFRKLKALGRPQNYKWDVFEGHLQPKGGAYTQGVGTYKKEVFALYKSYAAGSATENNNDNRASIIGPWTYAVAAGVVLMLAGGGYYLWGFFNPEPVKPQAAQLAGSGASFQPGQNLTAPQPVRSAFRIVGTIAGDAGTRVIVSDDKGTTRVLEPSAFTFDNGRPVSGTVDGQQVIAEDRVVVVADAGIGSLIP